MNSKIILYTCTCDKRVVDKTTSLILYKNLNGSFRSDMDITSPTFNIECNELPHANYCFIQDLNRYYFIDDVRIIRKNVFEIKCKVDVLMTYSKYIINSTQYVSRQENEYNELLNDNMVTFEDTYDYNIYYQNIDELDYANDTKYISAPTDKTNIILCVFGKQAVIVE